MIMATVVHSSIMLVALSLSTFKDVNTIKQSPKRFEEVFKI